LLVSGYGRVFVALSVVSVTLPANYGVQIESAPQTCFNFHLQFVFATAVKHETR